MTPISLRCVYQPGLRWNWAMFGPVAEWTEDPSFDVMTELIVQHLALEEELVVSYFAGGALNKLYAFDCSKGRYLMRVALQAAPEVKTKSEVATLAFVRNNTSIPVPRVLAHDSNLTNELGFEWMIMERIDAQPLLRAWHEMSWLKKEVLVQRLATFWVQLFNNPLSGIGSIFSSTDNSNRHDRDLGSPEYHVGEIILPRFFVNDRMKLDIGRGPYNSGRNYLNACLKIMQYDTTKHLSSNDEDDIELSQDMQEVYGDLKTIIPRYFPHSSQRELTLLYHRDVSLMNILVDSNGDLASLVDWECVAAVPAWQACDLPQILQGRPYAVTEVPQALDCNAGPDSIEYNKENLRNYELAQLRTFFLEEMQRLSPEWVETFRRKRFHHDILVAIEKSSNETTVKWVKAWLKALLQGSEPKVSLVDGCRSAEARQNVDWIWD